MAHNAAAAALRQAEALLKEWLAGEARLESRPARGHDDGVDIVVRMPHGALVVEVKATDRAATLAPAVEQAKAAASRFGRKAVPIVVVPFMGDLAQRLCRDAGVSWFDLSATPRSLRPAFASTSRGSPTSSNGVGARRPCLPLEAHASPECY